MSLPLHIIVNYIKENIITKLQKLYRPPGKLKACNKSPARLLKKPFCTGDLSPARKIFIERPALLWYSGLRVLQRKLNKIPDLVCFMIVVSQWCHMASYPNLPIKLPNTKFFTDTYLIPNFLLNSRWYVEELHILQKKDHSMIKRVVWKML